MVVAASYQGEKCERNAGSELFGTDYLRGSIWIHADTDALRERRLLILIDNPPSTLPLGGFLAVHLEARDGNYYRLSVRYRYRIAKDELASYP